MSYVKTRDGTRLYTKIWGEGRPVVLIHGWPLSADSWDDHAAALAEAGFRVISYDRRGFGRSDQPWKGYEYDTLSDDLADVLQATESFDAAIVGFSMGGGEVARYMSRHGGKSVSTAVLIASIVPYMLKTDTNPNGVPQAVFDDITAQLLSDRPKFFTGFFGDFYGTGFLKSPVSSEVIGWSRAMAMQAGLRPTLECAKAFATTDFRGELSAFSVPTLLIHGTADKTVPIDTSARAAIEGINGSELIELEGAPHGLLVTDKSRVTGELIRFFRTAT